MTRTAVAGDDEQPKRSLLEERAWRIFEFLRERTGKNFTLFQIGFTLGIPEGRAFREAMTRARKIAEEHDENITFCFADDGERVLCHNPDDTRWMHSKRTRAKAITAQDVNYLGHLEWGARHLRDKTLRKLASREAQARTGAIMMSDAFDGMACDLYGDRAGKKP